MKILAIGDFHGYASSGLKKFIIKNKINLIISAGDFTDTEKTRKSIFKYYNEEKSCYEIIGMKKAKEIIRKEKETTKKFCFSETTRFSALAVTDRSLK